MLHYSVDLGTTNTVVASWNDKDKAPDLIELNGISRGIQENQIIENQHAIPSAVFLGDLKRFLFFEKQEVKIGLKALDPYSYTNNHRFVNNFKPYLMADGFKTLTKVGKTPYSARKVTRLFLQEISRAIKTQFGKRPVNVTFSVPVDCYEPYRAQLKQIAKSVRIRRFKLIDEPVAAAVGYGLCIDNPQNVLVFDFGGGTLDIAVVRFEDKVTPSGRCQVIAKNGLPLGGNTVDEWLVDFFSKKLSYEFSADERDHSNFWYRLMLNEACRIKESLYFKEQETFYLMPPEEYQKFEARIYAKHNALDKPLDISREEFIAILEEKGLYRMIEHSMESLFSASNLAKSDIDNVLLVGGSSLLPRIAGYFEKEFGRAKVQGWQPFNAVAYGACAFGANHVKKTDFIVHDYAFITYDQKTLKPQYNIIIPKMTLFPTTKDFWKRKLTPTCSQGIPETIFKLVICEIGENRNNSQTFIWDEKGKLHSLTEGSEKLIIPLNESNPTLGTLNPAHSPSDRSARLEISFMINEEKWLCVTVFDLKTKQLLMTEEPVIQLR
ncbi:MAG: Hsp70 family protein [Spirochaetales bacterium]|nr:Hsp70 family protein [Spirochaetales bacterium]